MKTTTETWKIDSHAHTERGSSWELVDEAGERASIGRTSTGVTVAFASSVSPRHAAACAARLAAVVWDFLGDVEAGNCAPTELSVDVAALGLGIVRFYRDVDHAFTLVAVHFGIEEEAL